MFVISKTNKYFALFEKFRSVGKKRGVRRCGEMVTENCHKHLDILIHRLMFVEYNTIDSTQNWLVTWNPALFKWTSLSLHTISCHQSGQSECKSGWQSLHFFSNLSECQSLQFLCTISLCSLPPHPHDDAPKSQSLRPSFPLSEEQFSLSFARVFFWPRRWKSLLCPRPQAPF